MIITKTPYRISFFGGGSDYPNWFNKFTGQVLPTAKKVTYRITMKRLIMRRLVMGIADGVVEVDGKVIYTAEDLKVGLFIDTASF